MAEDGEYNFENPIIDREDWYIYNNDTDLLDPTILESPNYLSSKEAIHIEDLRGQLMKTETDEQTKRLVNVYYDKIMKTY